jgi:DNA-binding MarR family transcriptional regulator
MAIDASDGSSLPPKPQPIVLPVAARAKKKAIPVVALVRLLEQTGRALHSLGHDSGLFPAQWTALRYFASAPLDHRTAIALSRFQGMAFGPVNRTVRTLIGKGLLARAGSGGRGRTTLIEVTPNGHALLARDPLQQMHATLEDLSDPQREALAVALELTLRAAQARHHADAHPKADGDRRR